MVGGLVSFWGTLPKLTRMRVTPQFPQIINVFLFFGRSSCPLLLSFPRYIFLPKSKMASKSSIEKPQDEMLEEKIAEVRKAQGTTEVSPEDVARTRKILLKLDFRYLFHF